MGRACGGPAARKEWPTALRPRVAPKNVKGGAGRAWAHQPMQCIIDGGGGDCGGRFL